MWTSKHNEALRVLCAALPAALGRKIGQVATRRASRVWPMGVIKCVPALNPREREINLDNAAGLLAHSRRSCLGPSHRRLVPAVTTLNDGKRQHVENTAAGSAQDSHLVPFSAAGGADAHGSHHIITPQNYSFCAELANYCRNISLDFQNLHNTKKPIGADSDGSQWFG